MEQLEPFGCFAAAVATMLGLDYWEARRQFDRFLSLKTALKQLGRLIGRRPRVLKTRAILDILKPALLILTWPDTLGHTVVWTGCEILDPAFGKPFKIKTYERYLHKAYEV